MCQQGPNESAKKEQEKGFQNELDAAKRDCRGNTSVAEDTRFAMLKAYESHQREREGAQGKVVTVPREPTEAMVHALCDDATAAQRCFKCAESHEDETHGTVFPLCYQLAKERYAAVLSAATQPETRNATPPCKTDPRAPHGFDRTASHNADRYVCECESWEPETREQSAQQERCKHKFVNDGALWECANWMANALRETFQKGQGFKVPTRESVIHMLERFDAIAAAPVTGSREPSAEKTK